MSGYTKGPWEWWTSNSFLRLSSKATGKDGSVIDSYVMSDGHSSLSVTYADMALIAAAPELLEALQDAEKALFAALDNAFVEDLANGSRELIQARAAIAKALGQ